jgi:hypothetical protein
LAVRGKTAVGGDFLARTHRLFEELFLSLRTIEIKYINGYVFDQKDVVTTASL